MGRGSVLTAAVGGPRTGRELQSALVAVTCVDGPVAAGLAVSYLVPFAVAGRAGLADERQAAATKDRAGQRDLGDTDLRCSGLAVPSTHKCVSSLLRCCRAGARHPVRPRGRRHSRGSTRPAAPLGRVTVRAT